MTERCEYLQCAILQLNVGNYALYAESTQRPRIAKEPTVEMKIRRIDRCRDVGEYIGKFRREEVK